MNNKSYVENDNSYVTFNNTYVWVKYLVRTS